MVVYFTTKCSFYLYKILSSSGRVDFLKTKYLNAFSTCQPFQNERSLFSLAKEDNGYECQSKGKWMLDRNSRL